MTTILAQTTQSVLSSLTREDIIAIILLAIVPGIIAILQAWRATNKANTAQETADANTINSQSLATTQSALVDAQNKSPGPNIPEELAVATRKIANEPERPVPPPPEFIPPKP